MLRFVCNSCGKGESKAKFMSQGTGIDNTPTGGMPFKVSPRVMQLMFQHLIQERLELNQAIGELERHFKASGGAGAGAPPPARITTQLVGGKKKRRPMSQAARQKLRD